MLPQYIKVESNSHDLIKILKEKLKLYKAETISKLHNFDNFEVKKCIILVLLLFFFFTIL